MSANVKDIRFFQAPTIAINLDENHHVKFERVTFLIVFSNIFSSVFTLSNTFSGIFAPRHYAINTFLYDF